MPLDTAKRREGVAVGACARPSVIRARAERRRARERRMRAAAVMAGLKTGFRPATRPSIFVTVAE
jgi:hypothetical protein